jgi:hypothetical protein
MDARASESFIPFDAVKDDARELVEAVIQGHHEKFTVAKLAAVDVEQFAATRERAVVERVLEILWNRVAREEYGHAKAAVTLCIEAVRAAFPAHSHGAADGGGEKQS